MDAVKENDKMIVMKRKYEIEVTPEFAAMFTSSESLSSIFHQFNKHRGKW